MWLKHVCNTTCVETFQNSWHWDRFIRCKWILAFSYEYIYPCLLEFKCGWGIGFYRPNEAAHIVLTINECCTKMHWFSIILPKASNTTQLAYRQMRLIHQEEKRPMEINASVKYGMCEWCIFINTLSCVAFKQTVWIRVTVWGYNHPFIEHLGSSWCYAMHS